MNVEKCVWTQTRGWSLIKTWWVELFQFYCLDSDEGWFLSQVLNSELALNQSKVDKIPPNKRASLKHHLKAISKRQNSVLLFIQVGFDIQKYSYMVHSRPETARELPSESFSMYGWIVSITISWVTPGYPARESRDWWEVCSTRKRIIYPT